MITIICSGGGGVGKTTSSAALALSLCGDGHSVLLITVDPARRLAQALGIDIGASLQQVHFSGAGTFDVLMPDPGASSEDFLDCILESDEAAKQRLRDNQVYGALTEGLAGMHETVSLMLLARAVEQKAYDYVVIDTAPSRNAFDFFHYPGRLAALFEGRAVSWLAALTPKANSMFPKEPKSRLATWGKDRAGQIIGRIVGPTTMRELTELFAELAPVRERFSRLARRSEELLLGENARFVLVGAPTAASQADVEYLRSRLSGLRRPVHGIILNRADEKLPPWVGWRSEAMSEDTRLFMDQVDLGFDHQIKRADQFARELTRTNPGVPLLRLPTLFSNRPRRMVTSLSRIIEASNWVNDVLGRPRVSKLERPPAQP